MQRTIKFRAWDKTLNKIHCWSVIENHFTFEELLDDNFFEAMQYTGLKDRNGVEIYEGDILSYFGFKYEVIFEESAFGWYEDGLFYSFAELAIGEIARTDVVGNKYENPEIPK